MAKIKQGTRQGALCIRGCGIFRFNQPQLKAIFFNSICTNYVQTIFFFLSLFPQQCSLAAAVQWVVTSILKDQMGYSRNIRMHYP